jgi:hypothetical protein
MLSPGTHHPPPWCPGFLPLPLLPRPPPHAWDSLSWPLSLTGRFPVQNTLTYFPYLSPRPAKPPLSGPSKLLLTPVGSLSGRVKTQRLHSFQRRANGSWGPLFHFHPVSIINWNIPPADYSACHVLSHWYVAWLIWPRRWRRYVPPKHRFPFNGVHCVIVQKIRSFIITAVRTSNPALHLCSSINVRDQFSHPHKAIGKIIALCSVICFYGCQILNSALIP